MAAKRYTEAELKALNDCYLQSDAFRRGYAADRSGSDAVNPFRFDSVEYHDFIAGALVRERGWRPIEASK